MGEVKRILAVDPCFCGKAPTKRCIESDTGWKCEEHCTCPKPRVHVIYHCGLHGIHDEPWCTECPPPDPSKMDPKTREEYERILKSMMASVRGEEGTGGEGT